MEISACFTGHRELTGDLNELSDRLYKFVEQGIINLNLRDFYAGGAYGWDVLSAHTVIRLRENYPQIRLHLVLPCSNERQTLYWTEQRKKEFYDILALADDVEYTSQIYYPQCYRDRNKRLIERANTRCYCYYVYGQVDSGTAQTIRMARAKNLTVVNFYRRNSL